MRTFFIFIFVGALACAGGCYIWLDQPLEMPSAGVDLQIVPGTGAEAIATKIAQAGVRVQPWCLYGWFRLSGKSRDIQAGSYELDPQTTPRSLLRKLVYGEQALRSVTLLEGWTFQQFLQALGNAQSLRKDAASLSPAALMARLGKPGVTPEGRFFPDTYTYPKGSSDLAVLQRAMRTMDQKLERAWASRGSQSVLRTPEQALILASIVEKETGTPADRAQIAAVFHNRLRIGMRLQTDPTVIYGLGADFDGNLRKADLTRDSPWNTYTRSGLPPTPIAMPGYAALMAAVRPESSNALYFVARGDGSSQFSPTLEAHNRAVNKYQRGR